MGVSVLSQLSLCQALARACALDERILLSEFAQEQKGLILCSFQRTGAATQLGQHSAQMGQVPPALAGRGMFGAAKSPLDTSTGKIPLAWMEVSLCLQALLLGRWALLNKDLASV